MVTHFQHIAHRGGSHLAPENTLAAFRNALNWPIDAIELDVHMSRDGHVVVFHDSSVERLTDGEGNILDLDFAHLRSLNAAAHFPGSWPEPQQIPTLREVLEIAKGRVQVHIEMKLSNRDGVHGRYPHLAETVVDEIRAAGMLNQVLIISFDWGILPLMKSLEPALQTGMLISHETWNSQASPSFDRLIEQALLLECHWININHKLFTADMVTMAHERSLKLGLWTVNTLSELRRFAFAGVDSLTTDRPDLFSEMK